jgi:hypothetical protein
MGPWHEKGDHQAELKIGLYPLVCLQGPEARNEREPQVDHNPTTPNISQPPVDTPIPDRNDPEYHPSNTPHSRRKLQTSRTQPPLTRLRAKALAHDTENC